MENEIIAGGVAQAAAPSLSNEVNHGENDFLHSLFGLWVMSWAKFYCPTKEQRKELPRNVRGLFNDKNFRVIAKCYTRISGGGGTEKKFVFCCRMNGETVQEEAATRDEAKEKFFGTISEKIKIDNVQKNFNKKEIKNANHEKN